MTNEKIPKKDTLTVLDAWINTTKQLPIDFPEGADYVTNIIRSIEEYQAVLLLHLYNEDMIG